MKIYHAIFCYGPHNHLLHDQCQIVDAVLGAKPVKRTIFYGRGTATATGSERPTEAVVHVVLATENYENLPLKTYGLLKHALQDSSWDRLLKTDVNSKLGWLDADAVENNHLVGYCQWRQDGKRKIAKNYHSNRVSQPLLAEDWLGVEPFSWIGGPAYTISRELAQFVVDKGVWWARSWPYEDIMVSAAADEFGYPAVAGIGYYSDQDNFSCLHRNKP